MDLFYTNGLHPGARLSENKEYEVQFVLNCRMWELKETQGGKLICLWSSWNQKLILNSSRLTSERKRPVEEESKYYSSSTWNSAKYIVATPNARYITYFLLKNSRHPFKKLKTTETNISTCVYHYKYAHCFKLFFKNNKVLQIKLSLIFTSIYPQAWIWCFSQNFPSIPCSTIFSHPKLFYHLCLPSHLIGSSHTHTQIS